MDNIAKANRNKIDEVNKGFDELIKTFEHIGDRSRQTMPLLSSVMRLSTEIVKTYKEAFNVAKNK